MVDGIERIDGNHRVNKSFEDYSSQSIDKKGFKKKLEEMNSIHVPNQVAYMPAGGIGNLLNGKGLQNSDNAIQA